MGKQQQVSMDRWRLKKFDEFRSSLSDPERLELDCKIRRWRETMRARRPSFSMRDAQELFIALAELGE